MYVESFRPSLMDIIHAWSKVQGGGCGVAPTASLGPGPLRCRAACVRMLALHTVAAVHARRLMGQGRRPRDP